MCVMQKRHEIADSLGSQVLATAQTVADLAGKDPRTVKRDETPVAFVATPKGVKALYALSADLLEIAKRNAGEQT